jgi:hypothetical protein
MNHFSYDVIRKEKVRDLQGEGVRSQEFHRSRARRPGMLRGLPKVIIVLLGLLGIVELLMH